MLIAVRTTDNNRTRQINNYWKFITSRKSSIGVLFVVVILLLCFLSTMMCFALRAGKTKNLK